MNVDEYLRLIKKGKQGGQMIEQGEVKPNKYRNKKTVSNGVTYDSKKEAAYIETLRLLEKRGKIFDLKTQVKFKFDGLLYDSGRTIQYWADASYYDSEGEYHVIDVKGIRTPSYKIKKALMWKWHKIEVEEV